MTTEQNAGERPLPPRAPQAELDISAPRSRVMDLEQQARAFIRQRPVVALLAAVGAGYLVAQLVSRGRRCVP